MPVAHIRRRKRPNQPFPAHSQFYMRIINNICRIIIIDETIPLYTPIRNQYQNGKGDCDDQLQPDVVLLYHYYLPQFRNHRSSSFLQVPKAFQYSFVSVRLFIRYYRPFVSLLKVKIPVPLMATENAFSGYKKRAREPPPFYSVSPLFRV